MLDIHIQHKAFTQDAVVIEHLRLSIRKGEIMAIVGPSGAGKSTLLNIIAGLDLDYAGNIGGLTALQQQDSHAVGILFQEARLMPWLNVLENVELVAQQQGEEIRKQAIELLCQVGMARYLGAYPGQLSGGMAKRVALARAFLFNPRVLLMDEPFSSLDAPAAEDLREVLLNLHRRRGSSIVYVTHDLAEAVAMGDRVCVFARQPMRLLHEEVVALPRPRGLHDPEVIEVCQRLQSRFPAQLGGARRFVLM